MRFMLIVLATTALISPVMAQQQQNRSETASESAPATSQSTPALPSPSFPSDRRDEIRSELRDRIVQRVEQRLGDFKNALRLTPEQEARWPAFESGVRDFIRLRAQQLATMRDSQPSTPADRMRQRAESLAAMSSTLKRLADAEDPLYATLTDAQKDRFRDFVWLVGRPGRDLEDRDSSEGDRFRERDRWSYRHPHWRHHMRDEDEDCGDRREMMRRHHMRDEDDRDSHQQRTSRDRDRRSMCHCDEDRLRDERDRSWMDDD